MWLRQLHYSRYSICSCSFTAHFEGCAHEQNMQTLHQTVYVHYGQVCLYIKYTTRKLGENMKYVASDLREPMWYYLIQPLKLLKCVSHGYMEIWMHKIAWVEKV